MPKSLYPVVPGKRWSEIDHIAKKGVLTLFGDYQNLVQPQAMYYLFQNGTLEKLGFGYGIETLPVGEEGKYDPGSNEIVLSEETYFALEQGWGRAKFTLAHEIGHAVLHGRYLQKALAGRASTPQYKRSQIPAYADPECQANRFASAFLMPEPFFWHCMQKGMSVGELAECFGVSLTAAQIRYQALLKTKANK